MPIVTAMTSDRINGAYEYIVQFEASHANWHCSHERSFEGRRIGAFARWIVFNLHYINQEENADSYALATSSRSESHQRILCSSCQKRIPQRLGLGRTLSRRFMDNM
eukprot:gb/GECG01007560.1/.p1 GENE.gb/GECG01007560.1/~~gb/GECG01007560.1/.p1  ORF type:complete len:107 (+),score=7.50 gb/GECG01007560.1/:1-321(+)